MSSAARREPTWMSALVGLAVLLTLPAVSALFTGSDWLDGTLVLIIVITLTATVARLPALKLPRFLPRFLPGLLEAAVAFLTIVAVTDGAHAFARMLPTARVLSDFGVLGQLGFDAVRQAQAPTEATGGLQLLLLVWVAAVTIAADVVCCDLRSPVLAGLPLLAMYVMVAIFHPDGVTALKFIPAALGYVVLIMAGSPLVRRPAVRSAWKTAAVGLAAVLVAGFVPLPQPAGAPINIYNLGLGKQTVINPFLDLRKDLVRHRNPTVLTYRTVQDDPPPLRILADTYFNGDVWRPGTVELQADHAADDGLPAPEGLDPVVTTRPHSIRVTLHSLHQDFLPVPYPTVRTIAGDNWYYEPSTLAVAGRKPTRSGQSYVARYLSLKPTATELLDAGRTSSKKHKNALKVPDSVPKIVRTTAHRVAGDRTNKYKIAAAMQRFFRSDRFSYTTKAPKAGGSKELAAFLTKKRGYCVQFASAMAIMARIERIPARVAVGFLPGTQQQDGSWKVRLKDAHAWPELYFDGVGWIRFEPTPGGRTGTPPKWTTASAPQDSANGSSSAIAPVPDITPGNSPDASSRRHMKKSADASATTSTQRSDPATTAYILLGLAVALLVLILPRIVRAARIAIWRSRAPSAAEAEWRIVLTELADQSIAVDPSATPRHVGALLAETVPGRTGDIDVLVGGVERARYSLPGRDTADGHRLRRASRSIVRELRTGPVRAGLRTMCFPRSAALGLVRTSRRKRTKKKAFSSG